MTRGGVAAVLGRATGDDHGVHTQAAQDDLQIGAVKGAVPALGDDNLAGSGSDLRINLDAGFTLYQPGPVHDRRPQVLEAAHVTATVSVSVGRVDDRDTALAAEG